MKTKLAEKMGGKKTEVNALAEFDKLPVAKAPPADSVTEFLASLDKEQEKENGERHETKTKRKSENGKEKNEDVRKTLPS